MTTEQDDARGPYRQAPPSGAPPAIDAIVTKRYGAREVLRNAALRVAAGSVHALVGENGAGKSTLMKVLAGVYGRDGGRIRVRGEEVDIASPRAAQSLGISIIHQELNLMPHLTVAQNIFIGREPLKGGPLRLIDERELNRRAEPYLKQLGAEFSADVPVASLSGGNQQKVVLGKWLMTRPRIVLLNDPTRGIDVGTKQELYQLLRRLAESGAAILFYSTDYDELIGCCDRVLVLYNGSVVRTLEGGELTERNLVASALILPASAAASAKATAATLAVGAAG